MWSQRYSLSRYRTVHGTLSSQLPALRTTGRWGIDQLHRDQLDPHAHDSGDDSENDSIYEESLDRASLYLSTIITGRINNPYRTIECQQLF